MKGVLLLLILTSVFANNKHSYSDLCYRFDDHETALFRFAYQFYTNKQGKLLSADYIVDKGENFNYGISYYYHYTLSDCKPVEEGMECERLCESIWFKFLNLTGPYSHYVSACDPIFQKKYANIMEHDCPGNPTIFHDIKPYIGEKKKYVVKLKDGLPTSPDKGYKQIKECVWEYDILGLVSVVTLSIIGGIIAITIVIFLILYIFVQKHRSNKRKRLEANLLEQEVEKILSV